MHDVCVRAVRWSYGSSGYFNDGGNLQECQI